MHKRLKEIDCLFYTEYFGQKPSTKIANIDTPFNAQLIQSDSSFEVAAKTQAEIKLATIKLSAFNEMENKTYHQFYSRNLG